MVKVSVKVALKVVSNETNQQSMYDLMSDCLSYSSLCTFFVVITKTEVTMFCRFNKHYAAVFHR